MDKMINRLLRTGDSLIVAFPTSEGSYTHPHCFFFKVGAWYPFYYEWDQLGAMTAGESSGLAYLGSTGHGSGDDILRIEEDDFHVTHFWLTPDSPNMRVYKSISPHGTPFSSLDREKSSDWPTVGSKFDFYTRKMVYDPWNPPQVAENLVFRANSDDDGGYFQWGFYSEDAVKSPLIYLIGRGYKLIPITKASEKMEMARSAFELKQTNPKSVLVQVGDLLKETSLSNFLPHSWTECGCGSVVKLTEVREPRTVVKEVAEP